MLPYVLCGLSYLVGLGFGVVGWGGGRVPDEYLRQVAARQRYLTERADYWREWATTGEKPLWPLPAPSDYR